MGRRLRARRLVGGVSQAELARAIGVTYQQVQKYECGSNRISVSMLYRISEALGAPVSFFFDGLDDLPPSSCGAKITSRESFLALAGGGALVDAFLTIRPAVRRRIISLVREMAHEAAMDDDFDARPLAEPRSLMDQLPASAA